ncbi:MAG: hypothetical protein KDC92_03200 [Bacteroidetes bacterium]|nr:hypothetical protein [Bacteroidota bacterium]
MSKIVRLLITIAVGLATLVGISVSITAGCSFLIAFSISVPGLSKLITDRFQLSKAMKGRIAILSVIIGIGGCNHELEISEKRHQIVRKMAAERDSIWLAGLTQTERDIVLQFRTDSSEQELERIRVKMNIEQKRQLKEDAIKYTANIKSAVITY